MKFEIEFILGKPEIPTKDYRRIFASIIKNALSQYMNGELFEKFYKDAKQKDFTWSVIFNKPDFTGEGIKLGSTNVKMLFSTYDRENTGYFMYSAFLKIMNKPLPLENGNTIRLLSIRQTNQKIINKNSCIFKTIAGAPIVVREHNREDNTDKFYTVIDDNFNFQLTEGLKRQAIMAGFDEADANEISAKAINCKKNVVFNYGIYMDANTGFIEVSGKPYILQYFYQAGVLAHRSIGFGMLDLVAQKNI